VNEKLLINDSIFVAWSVERCISMKVMQFSHLDCHVSQRAEQPQGNAPVGKDSVECHTNLGANNLGRKQQYCSFEIDDRAVGPRVTATPELGPFHA
jgi:hypothetical protein